MFTFPLMKSPMNWAFVAFALILLCFLSTLLFQKDAK